MMMLKFILQIFQLNLSLNQFQIQTPLQLNQLMMMKWIIYCNSYIQNMMNVFCMLTSRCFNIDWWLPLLQNFIHSLLCCFVKTEERMLQSQIACHTFLCLSQSRPPLNWIIEKCKYPSNWGYFMSLSSLFNYIYPVGIVYYHPGHPSNTISSDALKLYVGFLKVTYEPLEHCYFVDPQGRPWISPYQAQKHIYYLQI